MTKVEVSYRLSSPLTGEMLQAIDRSHGVYGLQSVKVTPQSDGLQVLYDASRLKLEDVDQTLLGLGLPVVRGH